MGYGHIVTVDSAYTGELAAQVGREMWKPNMVDTFQVIRTSAGDKVKAQQKKMKVRTYELFFLNTRHYHLLLVYGPTTA